MKKESLLVLNRTIPYSVRESSRAQRLRIAVYADGDVVVTKPFGVSQVKMKQFVDTKKLWIINKIDQKRHPAIKELAEGSDEHFNAHKADAEALVQSLLDKWVKNLSYNYSSFSVKKHKSRWGSCSLSNKLSFNYKILFLPSDLQEYIVVHELCHTKRKDHSKQFWSLVATSLPEYNKLRIKIRALS